MEFQNNIPSPCSFCNILEETLSRIYYNWYLIFQNSIILSSLRPQAAIRELLDETNDSNSVLNSILLDFISFVYREIITC